MYDSILMGSRKAKLIYDTEMTIAHGGWAQSDFLG